MNDVCGLYDAAIERQSRILIGWRSPVAHLGKLWRRVLAPQTLGARTCWMSSGSKTHALSDRVLLISLCQAVLSVRGLEQLRGAGQVCVCVCVSLIERNVLHS